MDLINYRTPDCAQRALKANDKLKELADLKYSKEIEEQDRHIRELSKEETMV